MKFRFLGGAQEIGRLGLEAQIDSKYFLFDYGYSVGKPVEYPALPTKVDHMFVTHAHIDHIGMTPFLRKNYPKFKMYCSEMTREAGRVLLHDTNKVFRLNKNPRFINGHAIEDMLSSTVSDFENGNEFEILGTNTSVKPLSAGHIPGATMYKLENDNLNFIFTGDIDTKKNCLVSSAEMEHCDALFIEGTYGNEKQPSQKDSRKLLLDIIDKTISRGGKVLIPAFSFGKSQQLLAEIPTSKYRVSLDGMGNKILDVFENYGKGVLNDYDKLMSSSSRVNRITNFTQRKDALENSDIIVTTSGMIEGGPIIYYLKEVYDNPKNTIIIIGYQAEDTNGRALLEDSCVNMDGTKYKVKCEVVECKHSSHADKDGLLSFVKKASPNNVIIMHSESSDEFKQNINEIDSDINVLIPRPMKSYTLDV